MPSPRPVLLTAALAVLATACGTDAVTSAGPGTASDSPDRVACDADAAFAGEADHVPCSALDPTVDAAELEVDQIASTAREADVPSALDDPRDDSFPAPLVDLDRVISGGPPPDGIPAIDDPVFQRAAAVDWLTALSLIHI